MNSAHISNEFPINQEPNHWSNTSEAWPINPPEVHGDFYSVNDRKEPLPEILNTENEIPIPPEYGSEPVYEPPEITASDEPTSPLEPEDAPPSIRDNQEELPEPASSPHEADAIDTEPAPAAGGPPLEPPSEPPRGSSSPFEGEGPLDPEHGARPESSSGLADPDSASDRLAGWYALAEEIMRDTYGPLPPDASDSQRTAWMEAIENYVDELSQIEATMRSGLGMDTPTEDAHPAAAQVQNPDKSAEVGRQEKPESPDNPTIEEPKPPILASKGDLTVALTPSPGNHNYALLERLDAVVAEGELDVWPVVRLKEDAGTSEAGVIYALEPGEDPGLYVKLRHFTDETPWQEVGETTNFARNSMVGGAKVQQALNTSAAQELAASLGVNEIVPVMPLYLSLPGAGVVEIYPLAQGDRGPAFDAQLSPEELAALTLRQQQARKAGALLGTILREQGISEKVIGMFKVPVIDEAHNRLWLTGPDRMEKSAFEEDA